MKIKTKIFIVTLLILLIASPISTLAAEPDREVTATYGGDIQTLYNGIAYQYTYIEDGAGYRVQPLFYEDTTYLPLRLIAGLAKLNVEWDAATRTIKLTRDGELPELYPTLRKSATAVKATISPSIIITIDGQTQTLVDGYGKPIYPIICDGFTYLPVRALCDLVGLPVQWDAENRVVNLGTINPRLPNPTEMPANAKILTDKEVTFGSADFKSYYENGTWIFVNRVLEYDTGNLVFFNYDGYTKVTFTTTTGGEKGWYTVSAFNSNYISGKLFFMEDIDNNTTKTYTLDITGIKEVNLRVARGSYSEATVTNIYLH
jgi:hypothetical protein